MSWAHSRRWFTSPTYQAGRGGTARSPPPLRLPTPLFSSQRPQDWISVTASIWRLWVCRKPVSRDIDCYSLAKISEILVDTNILSTPIFVTFSAWRAGTISRYSVGESPPLRQGRKWQRHTWQLHVEGSTPSGRRRRTSARSGRSQLLWTLPKQ